MVQWAGGGLALEKGAVVGARALTGDGCQLISIAATEEQCELGELHPLCPD